MSAERLSRLQKWILAEAYRKGRRIHKWGPSREGFFVYRKEIPDGFYGENKPKNYQVIISRSIRNLEKKEYIYRTYGERRKSYYDIFLTESGVQKAKSMTASVMKAFIQ